MFDCECCWCCRSNCHHYGICGECGSGPLTTHDRQLLNGVKNAMNSQNWCIRCLLHCPAAYPCFFFAICFGCCCENNTYAQYKSSQLDQGHRFAQCVCFNYVMSFTMTHDPNYIHPMSVVHSRANPIINISNVNNNEVKTGDVNVRTGDVSNNSTNTSSSMATSSNLTPMQRKVKEARVEALIAEGRYSEAELIATEIK